MNRPKSSEPPKNQPNESVNADHLPSPDEYVPTGSASMTADSKSIAAPASVFTGPYRTTTIGMIALIGLMAFESLAVTTAMPVIAEALDGLTLYSMAFAGTLAASVLGMVVAGQMSDRIGARKPMWIGVALFLLGLIIAGTAVTMSMLVLGRVVQGLGSGALGVTLYVVVAQIYPTTLRPKVFAAFAAALVIPALVGPALTGFVVQHTDWRWVFFGAAALTVPAALMVRTSTQDLHHDAPADTSPDRKPVVLAGIAAACAVLLHFGGQQRGLLAAALIVLGLVGLVFSVPPLLPRGTLSVRRGLPSVIALRGLIGAGFTVAEVFLPLLLTRERGLTPGTAGLVLTAAAVTWSTGSWVRGRSTVTGAAAQTKFLTWGSAAIAVAIVLAAAPLWPAVPVFVAMIGWAIGGLGMGMAFPTLSILTLELSPVESQGANSSALQLADSLSAATFLAITGLVFALTIESHPQSAFLFCFGLALTLAVAAVAISRRPALRQ